MNIFSIPMQYDKSVLDDIAKLNETDGVSKVDTFIGALCQDTPDALGFENYRDSYYAKPINTIEDLAEYTKYAQSLGIEFQYCINAGKTMTAEELYMMEPKIHRFCDKLLDNGITILKVGNLLMYDYIRSYYGKAFKYYLSTTKEYSNILQYKRLHDVHPDIEEICLPTDLNKNIRFIKNLNTAIPDMRVELMVNEGCIYACPWRKDHTPHSSDTHIGILTNMAKDHKINMPYRMIGYYTASCHECKNRDMVLDEFIRKTIYPWDIPAYNKHDIYRFKFAGRDMKQGYLINTLKMYFLGIKDPEAIEHLPWDYFNKYGYYVPTTDYLTIKDMKEYYPKIDYYFDKSLKGPSCADTCGVECKYCYKCADKVKETFGIERLFPGQRSW